MSEHNHQIGDRWVANPTSYRPGEIYVIKSIDINSRTLRVTFPDGDSMRLGFALGNVATFVGHAISSSPIYTNRLLYLD